MFKLNDIYDRFKAPKTDLRFLGSDMHAHFLPGIDDGARGMRDAIKLLEGLRQMGYRHLVATPHIMADMFPNTPEIIRQKLREVRQASYEAGLDLVLEAAAEYMVDDQFVTWVEKGHDFLTLPGKHLLIETGFIAAHPLFEQVVFKLRTRGYVPVLAHPERYRYWYEEEHKLEQFKAMGCRMQLNLLSLAGWYGTDVQQQARKLLQKGIIDLLGTDIHHPNQLPSLLHLSDLQKLRRIHKKEPFLNEGFTRM